MLTMQAFHAQLLQPAPLPQPALSIWRRLTQANLQQVSVLKSTLAWTSW